MPVFFTQRQIVAPGDLLAEGNYSLGSNVYAIENRIYSSVLGLAEIKDGRVISVIPLKGCYIPRVNDIVIGKIIDVGIASWLVDINSPYTGYLQVSDALSKPVDITKIQLRKFLDIGDIIVAKVTAFDLTRDPQLTIKESRLGKVEKGSLVEISPVKVPRVIGKKGSMISMLEKELGCEIIVGQNGRILVTSRNKARELFAVRLIKIIEREAHISGLTDRIKSMIIKAKKEGVI
ncbi:MAG: RNA-binding protein [Thermoprotei archaeon]|nr:MAG: RNA-binding protein [Thermoprotei archaeon]RLF01061.1 MAG: RNA-binding protein [Thermoprotei archaeon]HDI74334.1 RNA-binding protein [Thermoprotei archaeon]